MLKCCACGEVFEEPTYCYDEVPYGEGYVYDRYSCCPCCGSECIGEAARCIKCGEYFIEDELYDGICEECSEEI